MTGLIGKLERKGYTYTIPGDGIYFDVTKFKDYGKLSHQNIEELKAGARVAVDEKKRHPQDFVLWKFKKAGEPFWEAEIELEVSDQEYEKLIKEALLNNDEEFLKLNKIDKAKWKR